MRRVVRIIFSDVRDETASATADGVGPLPLAGTGTAQQRQYTIINVDDIDEISDEPKNGLGLSIKVNGLRYIDFCFFTDHTRPSLPEARAVWARLTAKEYVTSPLP